MVMLTLAACGSTDRPSGQAADSNILIAYAPGQSGDAVEETAALLEEAADGDRFLIEEGAEGDFSSYEFVLLGFESENSVLPDIVRDFLEAYDFGAKTILPFAAGTGNDSDAILDAVSRLQPGALLRVEVLLISENTGEEEITEWVESLRLSDAAPAPDNGGNTVASAAADPRTQQVLYLWEEGNMPAVTEYTENNRGYSDDPDFRPYLTSYPVPDGTKIKGAVLICPGGAFQFRSDLPEGIEVAEALSALGYQSFVVDYRLRPYTQQEGALDPDYVPDELDQISADAAACGMIYSFYGRLSVGTTDVELLRSGSLPPTFYFYCYGTRDPFYQQFLANADAAKEAGVLVERLQLDDMPHGFGVRGGWIPVYDEWLTGIFEGNE